MGNVTPALKKLGGRVKLGVEYGQLARVSQHMDLKDSGLSNLQGDDPNKASPVEREEERFSSPGHLDQGCAPVIAEEIDGDIP